MKTMKRFLAMAALVSIAASGWAMTEQEQSRMVWNHLDEILIEDQGHNAYLYFCKKDMDNDGIEDLVITNGDTRAGLVYKAYSVGRNMAPIPVSVTQMGKFQRDQWSGTMYIANEWPLDFDDITLAEPPIFICGVDKAKNNYTGVWGEAIGMECYPAGKAYNRMVFKPHVGEVTFGKRSRDFKALDNDTIWNDICDYHLKDPAMAKKMFRGYKDGEAIPVVVTQRFLTTHNPMQFSRWLAPEPVKTMEPAAQQILLEHFGKHYRVERSQWLATLPTPVGNRSYYQVLLTTQNRTLFATVCLAEGTVASSCEFDSSIEEGEPEDFTIFGNSPEDVFEDNLPEIGCIMQTDKGIELYVRYNSMEGTHYSIWREVGTRLVQIFDEYHYWFY